MLGMSLLGGAGVGVPVLAAIFISNLPEGLSSAAGMKPSGRSARYVFGVWGSIAVASGIAGLLGACSSTAPRPSWSPSSPPLPPERSSRWWPTR